MKFVKNDGLISLNVWERFNLFDPDRLVNVGPPMHCL